MLNQGGLFVENFKLSDPLNFVFFLFCRRLCLAGNSGHVILFKFRKVESMSETLALEIPITYENFDDQESPECEFAFTPKPMPKTDSVENEKKVSWVGWSTFIAFLGDFKRVYSVSECLTS